MTTPKTYALHQLHGDNKVLVHSGSHESCVDKLEEIANEGDTFSLILVNTGNGIDIKVSEDTVMTKFYTAEPFGTLEFHQLKEQLAFHDKCTVVM